MHKATLNNITYYGEFSRYLATKLFSYINVTRWVLENYKSCVIMAKSPYATWYWAQFLEMDMH